MVRENAFKDDAHQRSVITQFDALLDSLSTYQVPPKRKNNTSKLFQLWKQFKTEKVNLAPRGIYLWGTVGCGKTTLMDLFFDCCPFEEKERVHFHSFMQEN
ncbi:hypothetical protein ANCDUO_23803 [Ancylostoma duodenale]|uniref:Uncharacterized protein n=1 Tax=Ancylostoma duodenale TaxID=51022 RepID=A0A0C2FMQ0_9BILA|nr:hypothetical protein ANCDUO_23803 [Ancylostoma duodenale]